MRRSVSVVIIDNLDKILVLKRNSNDKIYPGFWDLPGGRVEDGETLIEAAKREVIEESGLKVEPEDNYFSTNTYPDGEISYVFKANFMGGDIFLSEEHTEFKWISKDNYKSLEYTPDVGETIKKLIEK